MRASRIAVVLFLGVVLAWPAAVIAQPPPDEPEWAQPPPEEPELADEEPRQAGGAGENADDALPAARTPAWAQPADEAAGPEDEEEDLAGEDGGEDTALRPSESFPADTPAVAPTRTAAPPEPGGGEEAGRIPLRFELGGYYRARAVWIDNVPGPSLPSGQLRGDDAAFMFQRLRLEPSVLYGSNPKNPIAALHMQIDGLDNVVFGDNSRLAATPIFASDPSSVDIEGFDVPTIRLERAWLQFLIPVGQVRVGRMPSQWGLGILTSDGNGLGEWGDPQIGTTYDRLLFATRPLTIYNALARGDARPTPLIVAVAYDKLVEDPLGRIDVPADPEVRGTVPFSFLTDGEDDVQETVGALLWNDADFNDVVRESDELTAGIYFVNRWQESTRSDVYILDLFWRMRWALGPNAPSLYTAGEIVTIQGESRGISLAGGCDFDPEETPEAPPTGLCRKTDADIWGGVARVGLIDQNDIWATTLEVGYSSGDGMLFNDDRLTVRALHPDYHVGLLLYQVALANTTAINMGDRLRPLWSRGGVWNSTYIWPQARYEVLPGVEVHGAFLIAWADELLSTVLVNDREDFTDTACSLFEGDCMLGWEADLALRLKWGEDDLLWWDTELGLMRAGAALENEEVGAGLAEPWLWTVQSRVAMRF